MNEKMRKLLKPLAYTLGRLYDGHNNVVVYRIKQEIY